MDMITALDLSPLAHLTGEQFYQLCVVNRDISLQRTAKGELVIVTPVGGENRTGDRKSKLIASQICSMIWLILNSYLLPESLCIAGMRVKNSCF